ncbi:unnamed protein product, partial [Didymodactylos carnosus]
KVEIHPRRENIINSASVPKVVPFESSIKTTSLPSQTNIPISTLPKQSASHIYLSSYQEQIPRTSSTVIQLPNISISQENSSEGTNQHQKSNSDQQNALTSFLVQSIIPIYLKHQQISPIIDFNPIYLAEDLFIESKRLYQTRRKIKQEDAISSLPMNSIISKHSSQNQQSRSTLSSKVTTPRLTLQRNNSNRRLLQFGRYEIETFYRSAYPFREQCDTRSSGTNLNQQSYSSLELNLIKKIYVCEYCLKYFHDEEYPWQRHLIKCPWTNPYGLKLYETDKLALYEVNGNSEHRSFCQNLCLLARLFIDSKNVDKYVDRFLFYILYQKEILPFRNHSSSIVSSSNQKQQPCNYQIIGYFSKLKFSNKRDHLNLSCLLVLPQYTKQGFSKILIEFSYLLCQLENKTSTPERPLSDLGLLCYRSYWREKILQFIIEIDYIETEISLTETVKDDLNSISMKDIRYWTGFLTKDILSTLQYFGLIRIHDRTFYIIKKHSLYVEQKRKQQQHLIRLGVIMKHVTALQNRYERKKNLLNTWELKQLQQTLTTTIYNLFQNYDWSFFIDYTCLHNIDEKNLRIYKEKLLKKYVLHWNHFEEDENEIRMKNMKNSSGESDNQKEEQDEIIILLD